MTDTDREGPQAPGRQSSEPQASGSDQKRDTTKRVQSGLKWMTLTLVLFRFARLGTTVILVRILTPEEYGLVTMSLAFILAFQALRDIGFGPAFIQRKDFEGDGEHLYASTMFWVVVAISVAMFGAGWFISPLVASAFPDLVGLAPLLRGVLVLLLIESVSTTPTAILQRRLEFRLIAKAETLGVVLFAVLSVMFAVLGLGPWSVILGTLGSRLAQTVWVVRLAGWLPGMHFDRSAASHLFGFGRFIWGKSLLAASSRIVDKMVVGRLMDGATLGFYGTSHNLCTTASKPIYSVVLKVTFPALSTIQGDLKAMGAASLRAISSVALVAVPISVGFATVAEDLVVVVYGEDWREMAPIVRILAFYGIVMSFAAVTTPVLMALGQVKRLFQFALFGQIAMVGLFLVLGEHGARGIALGLLAATAVAEAATFVYMVRCLELPLARATAPILRVSCAAAVMAVAVLSTAAGLESAPTALRLVGCISVGVLSYCGAQFAVNRRGFLESLQGLRGVIAAR